MLAYSLPSLAYALWVVISLPLCSGGNQLFILDQLTAKEPPDFVFEQGWETDVGPHTGRESAAGPSRAFYTGAVVYIGIRAPVYKGANDRCVPLCYALCSSELLLLLGQPADSAGNRYVCRGPNAIAASAWSSKRAANLLHPAQHHAVPRSLRSVTTHEASNLVAIPERLLPMVGYPADGGELEGKLGGAYYSSVFVLYEVKGAVGIELSIVSALVSVGPRKHGFPVDSRLGPAKWKPNQPCAGPDDDGCFYEYYPEATVQPAALEALIGQTWELGGIYDLICGCIFMCMI